MSNFNFSITFYSIIAIYYYIIIIPFLNCQEVVYVNSDSSASHLSLNVCTLNTTNPCLHGICLANASNTLGYNCYCHNGWTGNNCDKDFDDCKHYNPCQNNATCINDAPHEKCICSSGFCGKYCEHEVNECHSNPCLNGGTCIDLLNSFQCECIIGYSGERCEIDKNVCRNSSLDLSQNATCLNGGKCYEGPGDKYLCICPNGITGSRCETNIDECESNPCLNGGICIDGIANFTCICNFDWVGHTCNTHLHVCKSNICKNNGICMEHDETNLKSPAKNELSIICFCQPDYHGQFCELQYNECDPNPCQNNGECIDGIDSFTCTCKIGFAGPVCEIDCNSLNFTTQIPQCIQISSSSSTISSSSEFSTSILPSQVSSITKTSTIWLPESSFSSLSSFNHEETTYLPLSSLQTPLFSDSSIILISPSATIIMPNVTQQPDNVSNMTTTSPFPARSNIFIPHFNGHDSYLAFHIPKHKKNRLEIKFTFKASKLNGMIFYTKGLNDLEVMLYIHDQILKMNVSTGKQQILFTESGFKISKESMNNLSISLWSSNNTSDNNNGNKRILYNAIMKLNDSHLMRGSQESISDHVCFQTLHFGKFPLDHKHSHMYLIQQQPFSGCLFDIQIDERALLVEQSLVSENILECNPVDICKQKPCRNDGKCSQEEDKGEVKWKCECESGYMGILCQSATCHDEPCQNEGKCLLLSDEKYICLCVNGWHGTHCKQRLNITIPAFYSNNKPSYIKYSLERLSGHLELRFRFVTNNMNQSKALLLFMGHIYSDSHFMGDFISTSFSGSEGIYFNLNLGNGIESLSRAINSSLTEHLVLFGHNNRFMWLFVDQPDNIGIKRISQNYKKLNVSPYLYVGGHESFPQQQFLKSLTAFKGCIFDIALKLTKDGQFEELNLTSIESAVNIEECNILDECHMSINKLIN